MDSLGGILIKGLLGNPILGHFSLGLLSVEVIDLPVVGGRRGGDTTHLGGARREEKRRKQIVISIRHNGKVSKKSFEVSDRTGRVSINMIKVLNSVKEAVVRVFIKEESATINPVVRIRNDRD